MLFDPKWGKPAKVKPVEKWRVLLLKAAETIEKRGHCKNVLQDARGRVCVNGALLIAHFSDATFRDMNFPDPTWGTAMFRLKTVTGCYLDDIAAWNNAKARTKDEVVSALRAAAVS